MTVLPRQVTCCSVVIPAHDESSVIAECLTSLAEGHDACAPEVIVVANGCRDDTAVVAGTFAGTTVVELAKASKVAALNAGDAVARAWPRIYVDADVRLSGAALHQLTEVLDTDRSTVAAPAPRFDVSASSRLVRAFYRVFAALPYASEHLVGLGVYGLSRAGRARFAAFPDVTADDLYVQRLFSPADRAVVAGSFTITAPRHLAALVAVRTRIARGNTELRAAHTGLGASTSGATARALVSMALRRPWTVPDIAVYAAVTVLARARASARRGVAQRWERDATSRTARGSTTATSTTTPSTTGATGTGGRVRVHGIDFSAMTEEQVADHVGAAVAAGAGGRIVTPNVDVVRQLRRRANRDLLTGVELVMADGMPLVWASRLAGRPVPERVTGAALVWALCRRMAAGGCPVFLLGAAPEVAAAAATRLREAIPGLRVSGVLSPPPGFEHSPIERARIHEELVRARPALVLVALGSLKQERLMSELTASFPHVWFLGCGAALDFASGRIARAPVWVQRAGFEWAFRLSREPRRLARRYLVDDLPYAAYLLARAAASRWG